MIYEKSPGSVWNVAFLAVAILLGGMAVISFVSTEEKSAIAASTTSF